LLVRGCVLGPRNDGLNFTHREIHGGTPQIFTLYITIIQPRSILLIFGAESDHVTADTLQVFKVKGSKVKVTWCVECSRLVPRGPLN